MPVLSFTRRGGASRRRWPLLATLILAASFWIRPAHADPIAAPLATEVKASFLYKFAPFIEWPPHTYPQTTSPFMICVVGAETIGQVLVEAVQGQTIAGRSIEVRRLVANGGAGGCQVLYLGRAAASTAESLLKAVAGEPVLTVSDEGDPIKGTILQFCYRDGRVRFTLNPDEAEAHHLFISAKLRSLAVPPRTE